MEISVASDLGLSHAVAAVAVAFTLTGSAIAATPVSSDLEVGAVAYQGANNDTEVGFQSVSSFTTSYPVSPVYADVYNSSAQSTQAYNSVTASWTSPDLGFVLINWGWNSSNGGSGDPTGVYAGAGGANWSYSILATANGTFAGTYNVGLTNGDAAGVGGLLTGGDWGSQVLNGLGTFSVPLVAGQAYTFTLTSYGSLSGADGLNAVADAQGLVSWSISGAPEVQDWTLLVAGCFGLGAVSRARRVRRQIP